MQDDQNVAECAVEGRRIVERAGPELDAEGLGQGLDAGAISPARIGCRPCATASRAAASPT
jgi:hypothetical protein